MKNFLTIGIVALVVYAVYTDKAGSPSSNIKGNLIWETDFAKAVEMSKKSNKPLLLNFTGSDWCHWCIKLDEEVFSSKMFEVWVRDNVIPVTIDFPRKKELSVALKRQNNSLAQKYQVQGFPTILFLDSSGKALGKSGYLSGGPEVWIGSAEEIIK